MSEAKKSRLDDVNQSSDGAVVCSLLTVSSYCSSLVTVVTDCKCPDGFVCLFSASTLPPQYCNGFLARKFSGDTVRYSHYLYGPPCCAVPCRALPWILGRAAD